MKKLFYIIFCLAIVLLSSCTSKKKLPKSGDTDQNNLGKPALTVEKNRFEEALNTAYDFKLLQSRAKYSLGDKSLSGRLNVERGKRLCMTVTVLGIEVARVEADQKKVVIVDKFDKLYTELSIEEFASQFGLQDEMQYDALECLLLGRMFVPGSGEAEAKDFKKINWSNQEGRLLGDISKPKYVLSYVLGEDNRLAETIVKANRGGSEASIGCKYSGYQSIEGGEFATSETLELRSADKNIKANLSLSAPTLGKAWTSFQPNEAYKKATIQEIMNAIKNLKN